jgi:hypothetical protein
MRRIRPHLTYANVVSTICLFVVLGGSAYAAFHLPKDSVKSKNIVNGQVKGVDVKDNNLTGKDIKESSLLVVLGCPSGFTRTADICYEDQDRGISNWATAVGACSSDGVRLPTLPEARLMAEDLPTPASDHDYWAADAAGSSAAFGVEKGASGDTSTFVGDTSVGSADYRCVTSPSA